MVEDVTIRSQHSLLVTPYRVNGHRQIPDVSGTSVLMVRFLWVTRRMVGLQRDSIQAK